MTDARDVIAVDYSDNRCEGLEVADDALAALRESAGTPNIAIDEHGQLWALDDLDHGPPPGLWRLVAPHPHQP